MASDYNMQVGGLAAALVIAILVLGGVFFWMDSGLQQTAQINNASPNQVWSSKGTGEPSDLQPQGPAPAPRGTEGTPK